MDWTKLSVGILTNAKFGRTTDDGRQAYIALICLHAQHGEYGRIPGKHASVEALGFEAVAFFRKWPDERIQEALGAAEAAGLIEVHDDASVQLTGFSEEHMPTCTRCRQPNPVPKHSRCPSCRGAAGDAQQPAGDAQTSADRRSNGADDVQNASAPSPAPRTGADCGSPARHDGHDRHDGQDGHAACSAANAGDGDAVHGAAAPPNPLSLWDALKRTDWLDKLSETERPRRLLSEAKRLSERGLDEVGLQMLVEASKRGRRPGALLNSWLERDKWREVLDEHDSKDRAKRARSRAGGTQTAASALGEALRKPGGAA